MKKIYTFLLPILFITLFSLLNSCGQKTEREENETEENDMYDGPDKAAEFEYNRTKNPFTGKVDRDKMWQAVLQTQQLKDQHTATPNAATALTWTERGSFTDVVGPSNGNTRPGNGVTSGRIRAVWVDLADATGKTVWVGGVDGGIWKTTDITVTTPTWTVVNDFLSNLSVSGICQDPTNTNTMYFCTGEAFFNGDAVFGNGVFKSIDHGVTWTLLPSTSTLTRCSKILCDAAGNVYVSTIGISVAVGLQRSTDQGATWTSINPFTTTSRVVDFEISSTGTMHVSAGLFSAAGVGGYRFTNSPATVTTATWSSATTLFTFPSGTSGARTELACAGNTVYAALANPNNNASSSFINAIAKSVDGGSNWTTTTLTSTNILDLNGSNTNGGQGWYAIGLGVDPSDANNVIVGSLNLIRSTDGGATFSKISEWVGTTGQYVHADQHNFTWYDNGNKFLVGCDGGVFYSTNKGTNFSDKNSGLRLKQFYSVAIHPTLTNYFLAGAQDNGTHQFNGAGLTSSVEVTGGDGAYVDIDQDQPQFQVGAYVYSNFRRSADGGATWSGNGNSSSSGQFINPFDYDDAGNKVYAGYNADQYVRWENPQSGFTLTPVTVTNFAGAKIASVTVSPYTANRVYFGTAAGRVIQMDNADATPTEVNITPAGMTGYVNSIVIGTSNQNLIATVTSTGAGLTNVWSSTNGGTSWTACDGNLPDMPVYCSLFNPDNNAKVYISTETGVWSTDALNGASTVWVPETTFPTVKTEMLRYRTSDRLIAASTHGRGIWTANLPSNCTASSITTQPTNTSACVSNNATFSITGSGTGFQWQESINGGATFTNITNGGIYSGATTTTLTLTGVTATMNNYQYHCIATGDCAPLSTTSTNAMLTVNAATSISSQPANSAICANTNTSFAVAATGASLTYQWQVSTNGGATYTNLTNTAPYSGVTSNNLAITSASVTLNGNLYRCIIGSACTPINSNAGTLTVNATPTITTQPVSNGVCAANNVTFTVAASGGGLTYQWQESTDGGATFNNVPAATSASYTFVATLLQNGYQYRSVVTGTCTPAVTSTAATLTVGSTLIINSQPSNTALCAGGNTSFTVNVSGTVTYQWQESTNGGATYGNVTNTGIYSGTTTATLTLTGVPATANNNLYRCVVSGSCPPINSNSASLTVNTAPVITTQPAVTSIICATQNASFSTAATGTALTYQWQESTDGGVTFNNLVNGGVYSNVTTAALNITGTAVAMNNYKYRCVIGGTCAPAATTSIATLSVYTPVSVSANPANTILCENGNASFSITAAGTTPTYQWQVSTNGGISYTNVANTSIYSGTTTTTLTLTGVPFSLNGNLYRCVISGTAPCGAANSAAGTLNINAAPTQLTVSGGGAYCAGSGGVAVGLSNSTSGIRYQLQLNGINNDTPKVGTGVALNFGNKTTAGIYTVLATNVTTGCTQQMAGSVTVIINPLPTISLNVGPYKNLFPGLVTTLTATATSAANPITYAWFKNNALISNTSSTLPVNITSLGSYKVRVTDANGCVDSSQVITIADSANSKLFIYPSPNDGKFSVVYYNAGGTSTKQIVTIYSSKGEKVYSKEFPVTQAYQLLAIDLRRNSAGIYYVILSDAAGNKIKTGEVLIR